MEEEEEEEEEVYVHYEGERIMRIEQKSVAC